MNFQWASSLTQQGGTPGHGQQQNAPIAASGALRSVEDLPACFRSVFSGSFRYFNSIQSDCFNALFHSEGSMVIAAPTGSGKTVLLELATLKLLSRSITPEGQFQHPPGSLKAVYLAPAKALVQEKVSDWQQKFWPLGLTIKEVTGDTEEDEIRDIDSADIICTTPEKFDAMTRRHRARGGLGFFNEIGLLLIDEVHLLSEDRGACLEAGVISRIKLVACKPEMAGHPIASIRYMAVSATVPNAHDLAEWLGAPPENVKVFGDEMRPVRLQTLVRGYNKTNNEFLFDRRLTDNLWPVLNDHSRGKPCLVFCPSRNGTSTSAVHVAREAARAATGGRPSVLLRDPAHHSRLLQAASGLADAQLRDCISAGVGFHHAAMAPDDRNVVESLFRSQDLLVLCTTSTLAVGVNLPAYLVVVKGTRRYAGSEASDPSGYEEYERSTVLQMVGRAGRPQFDTEGCAVIMTERGSMQRYQQLMNSAEPVESTLHNALPEYLNAEITLRTVTDLPTAIAWLQSTFLYVRVRRDPARYNVPLNVRVNPQGLVHWLREELVMKTVRELAQHGMVRTDEDGFSLEPMQAGTIMAEQYVRLSTMVDLVKVGSGAAAGLMPDLLWVLARSSELSNIKLRRNEKKVLNAVNKSQALRHHVMSEAKPERIVERISTAADKVFILINQALTDRPPEKLEYSLKQDAERAISVSARLSSAMIKYFLHEERASETFNALLLHKSLKQRMWTGSQMESRQIAGVGPVTAERLAGAGLHTLRQVAVTEPRRLESMAQRAYPWGSQTLDALQRILPPELDLSCNAVAWTPGGCVEMEITLIREEPEPPPGRSAGDAAPSRLRCSGRLLVGTLHDNALLACRFLDLSSFLSPLCFKVKTQSPAQRTAPVQVVASVVHETLVGVDVVVKTVIPTGARLDSSLPPPRTLPAALPLEKGTPAGSEGGDDGSGMGLIQTPTGGADGRLTLPSSNEKGASAEKGMEGAEGAPKFGRKTTPAGEKAKATLKPRGKAGGKKEGARDFMQRKLHEMKGLQQRQTPVPAPAAARQPAQERPGALRSIPSLGAPAAVAVAVAAAEKTAAGAAAAVLSRRPAPATNVTATSEQCENNGTVSQAAAAAVAARWGNVATPLKKGPAAGAAGAEARPPQLRSSPPSAMSAWRGPGAPRRPAIVSPRPSFPPSQRQLHPLPQQHQQEEADRPAPAQPLPFSRFAFTPHRERQQQQREEPMVVEAADVPPSAAISKPQAQQVRPKTLRFGAAPQQAAAPAKPKLPNRNAQAAAAAAAPPAAAPPPASKRLKVKGSSLGWLAAKFQAGVAKAEQHQQLLHGGGNDARATPQSVDHLDVTQALGFL